jgi:hypothetical protein
MAVGQAGAAHAASSSFPPGTGNYKSEVEWAHDGQCVGTMDALYDYTHQYWVVRGAVANPYGGDICRMWLERKSGGGWSQVTDTHYPNSNGSWDWGRTGWHWDGNDGNTVTRVCVFDASEGWTHINPDCSAGW